MCTGFWPVGGQCVWCTGETLCTKGIVLWYKEGALRLDRKGTGQSSKYSLASQPRCHGSPHSCHGYCHWCHGGCYGDHTTSSLPQLCSILVREHGSCVTEHIWGESQNQGLRKFRLAGFWNDNTVQRREETCCEGKTIAQAEQWRTALQWKALRPNVWHV